MRSEAFRRYRLLRLAERLLVQLAYGRRIGCYFFANHDHGYLHKNSSGPKLDPRSKIRKKGIGAKPNSLLVFRWCRRGDSNPTVSLSPQCLTKCVIPIRRNK